LFPEGAFFRGHGFRYYNNDFGEKVARLSTAGRGQPAPFHPKLAALWSPCRNGQADRTLKGGNRYFAAEHGFPRSQFHFVKKVFVPNAKIGMRGEAYAEIKIAAGPSGPAMSALRDAQALAFANPWRNPDLKLLPALLAGGRIERPE